MVEGLEEVESSPGFYPGSSCSGKQRMMLTYANIKWGTVDSDRTAGN